MYIQESNIQSLDTICYTDSGDILALTQRNTKLGGGGKARAGKIPPPNPFLLPARAIGFHNSQSGFSSKKFGFLPKRRVRDSNSRWVAPHRLSRSAH